MTDTEKLDLILSEMQDMKQAIQTNTNEIESMKSEIKEFRLHLENFTDQSIQLLAENFVDLTKRLNEAIPAADKNLAYEVKVNYLILEVEKLKKNVETLMNQSA